MTTSVITLPADVQLSEFTMGQQRFDLEQASDVTGSSSAVAFGFPRWRVSLRAKQNLDLAEAGWWEAATLLLRGRQNRIAVFDPVRALPLGTMRGSPQLSATAAAGANTAALSAGLSQAGATLLAGDWLQLGSGYGTSQLVKVTQNLTLDSSGNGTVQFEPELRKQLAPGTVVNYTRPVAYYGLVSAPPTWSRQTNNTLTDGFSFDLLEQWA